MAASAWRVYNAAKKYLENATINLTGGALRMGLYKASSNCSDYTLTVFSQLTQACSVGLRTQIKTLPSTTLAAGASAKTILFNASAVIFSASSLSNFSVLNAVIFVSGGKLVCWCALSTAGFTVTATNTLKIDPATTGIWDLGGGAV